MSKWRKTLKNKRRFDARYFLNEKVEGQEVIENSVQQEKLKKDFRDFSFDSWINEEKGKYDDGDDKDEKCDHVDCESVDEGHDGATKGHSEMSPATKARETRPFDYDDGEIADEVFEEESPIGKAEKSRRYGEPMEELVVPGVAPKGGADADGMTPAQIRMAKSMEDSNQKAKKARKDAKNKGLSPVVDEG